MKNETNNAEIIGRASFKLSERLSILHTSIASTNWRNLNAETVEGWAKKVNEATEQAMELEKESGRASECEGCAAVEDALNFYGIDIYPDGTTSFKPSTMDRFRKAQRDVEYAALETELEKMHRRAQKAEGQVLRSENKELHELRLFKKVILDEDLKTRAEIADLSGDDLIRKLAVRMSSQNSRAIGFIIQERDSLKSELEKLKQIHYRIIGELNRANQGELVGNVNEWIHGDEPLPRNKRIKHGGR